MYRDQNCQFNIFVPLNKNLIKLNKKKCIIAINNLDHNNNNLINIVYLDLVQ